MVVETVLVGTVEGTVVVGTVLVEVVEGTVPEVAGIVGKVVVVVVVVDVVVVDVVEVVVDVVGAFVVGTVVDGTVAEGPVGAGALGVGAAMVTVVHAPAFCMVATSETICARDLRSAASSDTSVAPACVTAWAAPSRPAREALTADAAAWSRPIRLVAATLKYCWATTPSAFCGPNGVTGVAGIASEALVYSPLLTYSSIANCRSARDAVSSWLCAADSWDCAAANCSSRVAISSWSAATAAMACW